MRTCWTLLSIILVITLVFSEDPKYARRVSEQSIETDHWAVEIAPGSDVHEIASRHGHEVVSKVHTLPGVFIFKKKTETVHGVTHPHHNESVEITWSENQIAKQQAKRVDWVSPRDPFYESQWHIHPTPSINVHANVEGAWKQGVSGEGVTIAVVDDGLEYTHPDLQANYKAASSFDFNYNDENPFPDSTADGHGTSAAGVAAARDNAACGVGTAYRAGLAGIRLISRASTDLQESTALTYKGDLNHIYTNSWGPIDDGRRLEGPGRLAAAAIESGITNGRNGKGSLYVWAGGNGRSSGDNCNYDGWANSRFTMTVAAVDNYGNQAWYSESCSMLLISAPSSGGSSGIWTTDLMGYRGSTGSDCTTTFGGTSAAAPLVAGIVALIIEKNPNLTWRDVQGVILTSAAPVAVNDGSWATNGAGLKVSHKFGFGMIDADAAVRLAGTWQNLPASRSTSSHVVDSQPILEGSPTESKTVVTDDFVVEHVTLRFVAVHPKRGELVIQLISPSGTVSTLAEKHSDVNANYNWVFGSIINWGERSAGTWTLRVTDAVTGRNLGNMMSWDLTIYGH